MTREALLIELLELFRQYGYEGVSIGRISEVTGLGKSSLYHHFPQGKEQMAAEVLEFIDKSVREHFIAPLKVSGSPRQRLLNLSKVVDEFYAGGEKGCITDGLTLGDANGLFQKRISACIDAWIQAIADVAVESGLPKKVARERAENVLVGIQGALIVSRALKNPAIFRRVVRDIPAIVLEK